MLHTRKVVLTRAQAALAAGLATVAYVSSGTRVSSAGATSAAPAMPASLAAGDLMIATVDVKSNDAISATAGWTLINQTNSGVGLTVALFWRVYQAGDTSPTFSWASSVSVGAIISRFTGSDPVSPIGAVTTPAVGSANPNTSPSLTSTAAASYPVVICATGSNTAFTALTGWTVRLNSGSATGGTSIGISSNDSFTGSVQPSGTATGSTTRNGGTPWVSQQIEILAGPA